MGSKSNKCASLTLNDPTSLFFWALITILFILVIGNFILTLSIISFFKIGMGMESIEIVPESKSIKFYGSTDFGKVYKKDGLIESFKDVPSVIEANESSIKLNIIDRKGQVHNRLTMDNDGTHIKSMTEMHIKDPDTDSTVFTTNIELLNNVNKPMRNLYANFIQASEIVSPVDQKLNIKSQNLFVKGILGTKIDGKDVFITTDENITLKSLNDSIEIMSNEAIILNPGRMPIATKSPDGSRLQNKLFACFNEITNKYTLVQVKSRSENDFRYLRC